MTDIIKDYRSVAIGITLEGSHVECDEGYFAKVEFIGCTLNRSTHGRMHMEFCIHNGNIYTIEGEEVSYQEWANLRIFDTETGKSFRFNEGRRVYDD